jgi:kynurenine formamidase
MYNGYDARDYITPEGALKNGIQHACNKIVTRGVLVDIARYKGVKRLTSGYVITVADMEGAARKQGVSFREGDVVLIRTGWIDMFYELVKAVPVASSIYDPGTEEGKRFLQGEPGIGWAVSQWLREQRSAAVAVDNLFAEVLPCEPEAARRIGYPGFDKPVNYELIRNQGMTLGKLFQLDELAEACAEDGVYEFLFIAPPMKLTHATGSPTNPLAIK